MAGSLHDPFITLARIGAPHGVRGAVRVKLFGEDAESLVA
jgi:ribosomal 30S subunit maturation factor RimM